MGPSKFLRNFKQFPQAVFDVNISGVFGGVFSYFNYLGIFFIVFRFLQPGSGNNKYNKIALAIT